MYTHLGKLEKLLMLLSLVKQLKSNDEQANNLRISRDYLIDRLSCVSCTSLFVPSAGLDAPVYIPVITPATGPERT
jgi:hypothetical protein